MLRNLLHCRTRELCAPSLFALQFNLSQTWSVSGIGGNFSHTLKRNKMSGNSQENIQVAKHYLSGITDGLLNATVRNKQFLPALTACVAYYLYHLDVPDPSLHAYIEHGFLSSSFWKQTLSSTFKLGLVALAVTNYKDIYYTLMALPRDIK